MFISMYLYAGKHPGNNPVVMFFFFNIASDNIVDIFTLQVWHLGNFDMNSVSVYNLSVQTNKLLKCILMLRDLKTGLLLM